MRKEDLKDGMVLELRIGCERVYIGGRFFIIDNINIILSILSIKEYDNDLKHFSDKDFDIMKVKYEGKILWERDEVDWSKIPVDTKVLVKYCEHNDWRERYFAKYEDGKVYVFMDGATSWSSEGNEINIEEYSHYKLCINPNKTDWSKVPVDTKVLVRDGSNGNEKWVKRYFAKYKDGKFYTYPNGATSWNAKSTISWDECELAEE